MSGAGRYREKAEFERQNTAALDAYGNSHTAWEALFSRKADFRETTGKERVASGAVQSPATGTMRIRYSTTAADITAGDRVKIRGGVWNIHSIVQVDRKKKQIELLCQRGGST